MHTAHILMEPAGVSQVEMQFSQCVSFPSWAEALSLQVESSTPQLKQLIMIRAGGKKTATATGRGVIANNNYSCVLAQGWSTPSCVLENCTERPWPCPQR